MAVKIRLMRIGSRGRPFYRVVAVDERKKRTGGFLEILGTYNPLSNPKQIDIKQDLVDKWVGQGAQLSEGFLRIIGKAPQHPIRPAKKQKAEKAPEAPAAAEEATAPAENEAPVESAEPETVESAGETPVELTDK